MHNEIKEQNIPVSGTPEAIACYMRKKWKFTHKQAAKAVSALLLKQECDRVGVDIPAYPNPLPKLKLEDFPSEKQKAKGMVADSRVFINLNKTLAEAYASIPEEVIDWVLSDNWPTALVKGALHLLFEIASNIKTVPDGLECVCMRAWKYVDGKINVPFKAEDIMPCRECSIKESSNLVCDLMTEGGRAKLMRVSWECVCYKKGNYCQLSLGKVEDILKILEGDGILKKEDDFYVFL